MVTGIGAFCAGRPAMMRPWLGSPGSIRGVGYNWDGDPRRATPALARLVLWEFLSWEHLKIWARVLEVPQGMPSLGLSWLLSHHPNPPAPRKFQTLQTVVLIGLIWAKMGNALRVDNREPEFESGIVVSTSTKSVQNCICEVHCKSNVFTTHRSAGVVLVLWS